MRGGLRGVVIVLVAVAAMFLVDSHDDGICGSATSWWCSRIHHPSRLDRITAASLLFN